MNELAIKYRVVRRSVKHPRLELWGDELRVIVPENMDPLKVMRENRRWILRQAELVRKASLIARSLELIPRTRRKFKALVHRAVKEYEQVLNLSVNKVFIRKMKNCWGSCSGERNITINREAQFLPEKLVRYIIYHELCHLIRWRHDKEFNELISREFPDYEHLDLELQAYWIKLREMQKAQTRLKPS